MAKHITERKLAHPFEMSFSEPSVSERNGLKWCEFPVVLKARDAGHITHWAWGKVAHDFSGMQIPQVRRQEDTGNGVRAANSLHAVIRGPMSPAHSCFILLILSKQQSKQQQIAESSKTMITFLSNLWIILAKAPALIGIIKALIDIVGSAQVQSFLTAVRDALKQEVPDKNTVPETEPERERLFQRIRRRMALADLNISEMEYVVMSRDRNTPNV